MAQKSVSFGEWLPDLPALTNPGATEITNVIATATGYRPLRGLTATTSALSARCQGAFGTTDLSGNAHIYAGDATKLYLLSGGTFNDASRLAGGAYATPSTGFWRFAQYGALCLAVNGVDAPQKISMAAGTNFEALGGSPPIGKYVATMREFVCIGGIVGDLNSIQWSGSGNAESWTIGTLESDTKTFPDGGVITGLTGGEIGYVFQERAITRMLRVSAPISWQMDTIETARGCYAPGSLQKVGNLIFFLATDGFYVFDGQVAQPIGTEKVDRTFFADFNTAYLDRVTSAVDPNNKLYIISYPSTASAAGTPDRFMIYNYAVKRWSYGEIDCECISTIVSPGYTLDSLAALYGSLDAIPLSLDARFWQGGLLQIGGFDADHKLGSFESAVPLESVLTTAEYQLIPGRRAMVTQVWPLVTRTEESAPNIFGSLGYREYQSAAPDYTAEATEVLGLCGCMASARFHRVKMRVAVTDWGEALGVLIDYEPDGIY